MADRTQAIIDAALEALDDRDWALLTGDLTPELAAVFRERGYERARQFDFKGPFNIIDERAAKYARERGGELITDLAAATPDMMRATIEQAIAEGWSSAKLRDALVDNYAFSAARAGTIARTELATAHGQGQLFGAKTGGSTEKLWLADETACPEICAPNAAAGWIPIDDDFPSGDDAPAAHPNDGCDIEFR